MGIRTTLIFGSLFAGVSIALCAFVGPGQMFLVNWAVLALAGAGRSLQLTAITMVNFADIAPPQRQPASVLSSLTQQVGMGAGVAIGALLLSLSQALRGAGEIGLADFRIALIITGAFSAIAALFYLALAKDVGAEISGHRAKA